MVFYRITVENLKKNTQHGAPTIEYIYFTEEKKLFLKNLSKEIFHILFAVQIHYEVLKSAMNVKNDSNKPAKCSFRAEVAHDPVIF